MNKKLSVCLILVVYFYAQAISVSAQTWGTLGIEEGDTFVYNVYNSNTSPIEPYEYLTKVKQRTYKVGHIEGSKVDWYRNDTFEDGHSEWSGGTAHIEESVTPFFFYANLNEGDQLFSTPQLKIDETVIRTYPEGTRETNHFVFSLPEISYDIYFDKQTGVYVDSTVTLKFEDNTTYTEHIVLKESNVWVIPEFPSWIVLQLLIMFAISLVLIVYFKKRNH